MATVSKGAAGEILAARFLRDNGYEILAADYRCRFGEIDIIAADKTYILFIEVKTRENDAWYEPKEAVDALKQDRFVKTAEYYAMRFPDDRQPRFDVIEVVTEKGDPFCALSIRHLKNAFEG